MAGETNFGTVDKILHKIFSNRGDKLRQKSDQKWLIYSQEGQTSTQGTNFCPRYVKVCLFGIALSLPIRYKTELKVRAYAINFHITFHKPAFSFLLF